MSVPVLTLTVVGVLGTALVAGVFFAFSAFVMPALARVPPAQGIAAMQSINVTAVRAAFMTALFGTALVCLVLGIVGVRAWGQPYAVPLLLGSVLYLVGAIVVTSVFHVPLNDALATVDPAAAGAVPTWTDYLSRWGAGNQVRWLVPLAGSACYALALIRR